ncbi:acyl carrier protein [Synergistaceae bacterium OttesenSCG-928-I11]|nr:acyl carrier protein [Synergistaceae bacterium OttesenSCG-928-I11]
MDIKEKQALFEEVLGYEGEPLQPAEKLQEVIEWDSMGIFAFIVMLDKKYDKRIKLPDVVRLETVQDALDLMHTE